MKVAIEFNNVNFGYNFPKKNIDNVSFKIFEGEYVCIIGHNGSGKSTISKLITNILIPWSGKVKILDKVINEKETISDKIGIIFQDPDSQFIGLSGRDDIAFGLENRCISRENMEKIIDDIANKLNIAKNLDLQPAKLSGGEKQKVAIASVLAIDSNIIIFDEATSMLEPKAKMEIRDLIIKLKKNYHKTIISITHNMDEVVAADKVIVMESGKLAKFGTPKEIFSSQDELVKLKLDLPFITQVAMNFKKIYPKFKLTFDSDELIKQIIKYEK
jgi:energy-coupling factor transport system ATP-binding protein